MKRNALKLGAIIGAAAVSTLAVAPAFAAAATSQATAQSIDLAIGGSTVISQKISASNNGTTETRNNANTVPTLADLLVGNNAVGAGVAPQDAHANADGTSFACAGLAGTGGGIAYVGHSSCDVDKGQPLTLNLGSLQLDLANTFGGAGQITTALQPLNQVLAPFNILPTQLSAALANTPLGQISLFGALSTIESDCTANPDAAKGGAEIADTSGDRKLPIRVTIPTGSGGTQTLNLADIDVSMEPRPGGYDVLVDLDKVFNALVAAIEGELTTAVGGALNQLNTTLVGPLLDALAAQVVGPLVTNLRDPLLQKLSDNVLKVVVLDRTFGDGGRSVDVKALRAEVLPAAAQFSGSSLVHGVVGHVTCGPNTRATTTGNPNTPAHHPHASNPHVPSVPNVVDSGLAGHQDHTARNVLGATAALMLLAGTAGLMGYRRMLNK